MTGFLIGLAVVYLAGAYLWSRVYYVRRHRVGWDCDLASVFLALVWPITVFTHWSPELCTHPSHVMSRAAAQQDYDSYQQALGRERRG